MSAASLKAAVVRHRGARFLKQVRVERDLPHSPSDEEGRRIGLKIAAAGSAAIGVGGDSYGEEQPAPEPNRRAKEAAEPERLSPSPAVLQGSKRSQVSRSCRAGGLP